jgi:hypothetical protein
LRRNVPFDHDSKLAMRAVCKEIRRHEDKREQHLTVKSCNGRARMRGIISVADFKRYIRSADERMPEIKSLVLKAHYWEMPASYLSAFAKQVGGASATPAAA